MKKIINILVVTIVAFLLFIIPIFSGKLASQFDYSNIDPNGIFGWISIHHLFQAMFIIAIIGIVKVIKPVNFGFNKGNYQVGLNYVKKFTIYFLIYAIITFTIFLLLGSFNKFASPLTPRNIIGALSFQLFLSGTSEEILFRAFPITIFAFFFTTRLFKNKLGLGNLIAAIIFALAHIGIGFSPLSFNYDIMQLGYAFVLGLIYGDCYEKTKSVFYPMMLHSISNVISVGFTIFISFII